VGIHQGLDNADDGDEWGTRTADVSDVTHVTYTVTLDFSELATFSHQHMIFDGYVKQTSSQFLRATQEEVM